MKKADEKSAASVATVKDWMKKLYPAVVRGYLRTVAGGSGKDNHGGYFDAWIE